MDTVDLTHAKDHLAELLERAVRGEDVRISDAAIGTVRLTEVSNASRAAAARALEGAAEYSRRKPAGANVRG